MIIEYVLRHHTKLDVTISLVFLETTVKGEKPVVETALNKSVSLKAVAC